MALALARTDEASLYIDGRWVATPRAVEVRHKWTGKLLGRVGLAEREHVEAAVAAAQRAARRPLDAYRRYVILRDAARMIEEQAEAFARLIAQEGGKPLKDARAEVERGIQTLTLSAEEAKRLHGETVPLDAAPGGTGRVGVALRVPVGVVAAIAPFNFPLNLVLHKVGPALAAGNAVVLKPATATPLTAVRLCEIFERAGLPAGFLNLVVGPGDPIGDWLVESPAVRLVTFTGSPAVARRIQARAGLKKVVLELGNNSANIVHADADLPRAAELLARKAYGSAGQFCVSVQRIYVHRDVAGRFADLMAEAAARLKVGDPEDPETDVGPLISEAEARRVEAWIEEAVAGGARVLCGGRRTGALVEPTLLAGVRPDMKVVCQEVFGPVASIVPYDDFDEAVRLVNDSPYGLQAGVFTRDLALAWKAALEIECGGVIINDTSSFRADLMPYGGVKESGVGREGPRYAVEEMTEVRMVVFNLS